MKIVSDNIDGEVYVDVLFSSEEVEEILLGEMVSGNHRMEGKRFYIGARLQRDWDYEDEVNEED